MAPLRSEHGGSRELTPARVLASLKSRSGNVLGMLGARVAGTIVGVSTGHPAAALTFDDGPHPVYTPQLLRILRKHGARATFFMIGRAAQQHPGIVRMAAEAGHAIGVHSWDHPSFPCLTPKERRRQIRTAVEAMQPHCCRLFRPPFTHQTPWSRLDAFLTGHEVVAYNAHALDWEMTSGPEITQRLREGVKPGSIVLLHDALWTVLTPGTEDRTEMLNGLDCYLNEEKALRFVTVPELLKLGRPLKKNWYVRDHDDWN